jgi:hypothetical protein
MTLDHCRFPLFLKVISIREMHMIGCSAVVTWSNKSGFKFARAEQRPAAGPASERSGLPVSYRKADLSIQQ